MSFERLQQISSLPLPARPSAFMGFDGFIDTVGRLSHGDGEYFNSMAAVGRFLVDRQESNCALEVSRSVRKLGGNMPICANALAVMGMPVSCIGAMGIELAEPAFKDMSPNCTIYPVAMPGECLALEFMDSKLFLADMRGPRAMSWEAIVSTIGLDKLIEMADAASLLGLFNWGELPNVQQIWEGFARDILPSLSSRSRTAVFDLSDCSGRSDESILSVLTVISRFKPYATVVLSANDNEVLAIARALGCGKRDFTAAGQMLYGCGATDLLVHHALSYARIFGPDGVETVAGIHIDNPVLVTGGGDHFNAGLCLGLLCGLNGRDSALLGNTVSRLYVSTGECPALSDVLEELEIIENKNTREEEA